MPFGKGTYGSKKGRPAKKGKKENPFAKKAAGAKKPAAKKGASKMPPAMLKRMEAMKKKKGGKK